MTFGKIAFRNVRRNGRRTGLTVFIIAVGLATLVMSNGLYDGFHEKMVTNAVRIFMGHLQVHGAGFHANPTVENCVEPLPDEVRHGHPAIAASARRVRFQALASTPTNSLGVIVIGIEPDAEAAVTFLRRSITDGTYLPDTQDGRRSCLVGETLFRTLRLSLHEKLILISQAADGSLAAEAFRVSGIVRTGNPEIDRSFVWIPLAAAQEMLAYGTKISETVFLARRADDVPAVQEYLVRKTAGLGLEVLSWKEVAPDIVQLIELDIAMQRVLMLIISIIVGMAIMNTMLMALQERYAEFGVLLAMGTTPAQIVGMVLAESLLIGILGVAAGLALTAAAGIYFYGHGVNLASFAAGVAKFIGMETTVRPLMKPGQIVASCLAVLTSTTLISLIPACRAAKMNAIQALRHI